MARARHLVLVVRTRARLRDLNYQFDQLAMIMRAHDLATLQLVWPDKDDSYQSRNPFAGRGVVEDPATGAAAAAFGAYLRHYEFMQGDAAFTIHQGVDMGRPSQIRVNIDDQQPGIKIIGSAVPMEE